MKNKKTIWVTVTGMNHYYGTGFLKRGMILKLKKEPKNTYDKEAIKVKLPGLGKIGYIANSPYTVADDCWSAGRIYDLFDKKAKAKVKYILPSCAVCQLILEEETVENNPA